MDLNYSADELAFRDEVRSWLQANLPADLREKGERFAHLSKDDLMRWHRILAKRGWVAPHWPKEWGGTGWNVHSRRFSPNGMRHSSATSRNTCMSESRYSARPR